MSKTNKTTDKYSNLDAVLAAARRAAAHLVPTAEELARYAEQDRASELAAVSR
ncbi:hypothetical protein [Ralstonia pseudosolanacearum]|uniref:hypothetical protein n=1 Tax=Ralstonia pseudosolanacearum TaxID=1310165 RepID=UPI00267522A7|nr:hypothetical protein [Ralstonia pseudosolanacearum]MDO3553097.1 hypothetical protein [Ralstonia pseudosolanacearum]